MRIRRLIGAITVRNGWGVQSSGYTRYLPLGRPALLAQNLERWAIDEILVQSVDRTVKGLGPDLDLLASLARIGLATPLVFGGGIRRAEEGLQTIREGADRLCLESMLHDAPDEVERLAESVGAQALIGAIPLVQTAMGISRWDYRTRSCLAISERTMRLFREGVLSEVLVVDPIREGAAHGFDEALLSWQSLGSTPRIAFGGAGSPERIRAILEHPAVSAVAIGNPLAWQEHAIDVRRAGLEDLGVRGRP